MYPKCPQWASWWLQMAKKACTWEINSLWGVKIFWRTDMLISVFCLALQSMWREPMFDVSGLIKSWTNHDKHTQVKFAQLCLASATPWTMSLYSPWLRPEYWRLFPSGIFPTQGLCPKPHGGDLYLTKKTPSPMAFLHYENKEQY